MTLDEFRNLTEGTQVFVNGVIDSRRFENTRGVITDIDNELNFDYEPEVTVLFTYNDGEDDWWIGEEDCELVSKVSSKSGLTKFLEATGKRVTVVSTTKSQTTYGDL